MYLDKVANGAYSMNVLRGWPNDGAREKEELIKQGVILVASQLVSMAPDGTVDVVGSTATNAAGLVIRGNGDSSSNLNANGQYPSTQIIGGLAYGPNVTISALTWATGVLTVTTSTNHGFVAGQAINVNGSVSDTNSTTLTGNYTISALDGTNPLTKFTVAVAANPGTITVGTTYAAALNTYNTSGKATVLWGNYIVATSNYASGSWTPGALVTAKNGVYTLAAAGSQLTSGNYTYTPPEPAIGFVLKVQQAVTGVANTGQTAHVVISCF